MDFAKIIQVFLLLGSGSVEDIVGIFDLHLFLFDFIHSSLLMRGAVKSYIRWKNIFNRNLS